MQQRFLLQHLIACSTCFGHHYAHHQELKSVIQWLLPVVFRAVVFQVAGLVWSWGLCVRFAGCCSRFQGLAVGMRRIFRSNMQAEMKLIVFYFLLNTAESKQKHTAFDFTKMVGCQVSSVWYINKTTTEKFCNFNQGRIFKMLTLLYHTIRRQIWEEQTWYSWPWEAQKNLPPIQSVTVNLLTITKPHNLHILRVLIHFHKHPVQQW